MRVYIRAERGGGAKTRRRRGGVIEKVERDVCDACNYETDTRHREA